MRGDGRKGEKEPVRTISNLSDLFVGLSDVTQIFLKMPTNLKRTRSWKWHRLFIEALQNCRLDWYFVQNSSKQLSARVCREYRRRTDRSLWWNINPREKSEREKTNEGKMCKSHTKRSLLSSNLMCLLHLQWQCKTGYCIYINVSIISSYILELALIDGKRVGKQEEAWTKQANWVLWDNTAEQSSQMCKHTQTHQEKTE